MDEDGNGGECLDIQPGTHLHEHTAFGDYEVYADSDAQNVCFAADNAISESEFERMETAWYNIHHGVGMDIHGTAADKLEFNHMLAEGMQHSETFRHTMEELGNDTGHTEQINLGHNQAGTIGDSFYSNAVDLADLGKMPSAPGAGHHNEVTRTEEIEHILEERHDALVQRHAKTYTFDPNNADDQLTFGAAHQHGIDAQNHVRDERGQSHVVSQTATMNPDGSITGDIHFANGDDETMRIDNLHDANITSITPPNDH